MDPTLPSAPTSSSQKNIVLIILLVLGFVSTFAGGFFLSTFLASEQTTAPPLSITPKPTSLITGTPIPTPAPDPDGQKMSLMNFDVGKHYFDDTMLLITKTAPFYTFVATTTRTEGADSYTQNTRSSFYNGTDWVRKTDTTKTNSPAILPDALVSSWQIAINSSRVLKEQSVGAFTIGQNNIGFSVGNLQNEMTIRSLPGYTKFMSEGNGTLTIDGTAYPAHALYTRIYSSNTKEIQFYNAPIGVTTDWLAFWDANGTFYHIDASDVAKPTDIYMTHQLGVVKHANGAVEKTFSVASTRDTENPPTKYTISLNTPERPSISFTRKTAINKAPDGAYSWFLGTGDGVVTTNGKQVSGIGVVEYIHD